MANGDRDSRGHGQVSVLGVGIDTLSVEEVLEVIRRALAERRRAVIANVNIRAMNLAYELPWFRVFLNRSDVVFCDGFGVILGARLLGISIPHRFTPPDWIGRLAEMAGRHHFTVYFLGARPGVVERAAARLKARFPDLRVAGMHHGYFDKTPGSAETESVVRAINAVKPDILILGLGMPLQERWLMENWPRLEAGVALTAGALFDYLAGEVRRGPRWMTDRGLEWLARLLIEPRRLWARYLVGNPLFLWRVLKQRLGWLRFKE